MDPVIIDQELAAYAYRFEEEIGVSADGISLGFGDLDGYVVGTCSIGSSGRKITIDREFWDRIEEHVKEELMYHELGHCAMYLDHDESIADSGCPVSVMYPYVLDYCYLHHADEYKQDLRGRRGTGTLSTKSIHEIEWR